MSRNNPTKPTSVNEWREFSLGPDTVIYGDFVLAKGETVNDGKIGIAVVNLSPGDCGLFAKAQDESPQVHLKFFTVDSRQEICEFTFRQGSGRLDTLEGCSNLPWSVIEISAINSKDNWVAFNLRKR